MAKGRRQGIPCGGGSERDVFKYAAGGYECSEQMAREQLSRGRYDEGGVVDK